MRWDGREVMGRYSVYFSYKQNPELDQLSGRFSVNKGKFGMLLYRHTKNYDKLLQSCKDTVLDGRGFIVPLGDIQLIKLLAYIEEGKRNVIDSYLEDIFVKIIS